MYLNQSCVQKNYREPANADGLHDAIPDASSELLQTLYNVHAPDHVFMLVDATLRRDVAGYFDLDSISQRASCLFDGDAARDSAETAPWLVDLSLPPAEMRDSMAFHRKFFRQHWPVGTSILIQTDASFDNIRSHLRRFIRLPMLEDDSRPFFRFWDPRVLGPFLTAIENDPPRLRRMMMTDEGLPIYFLLHEGDTDWQYAPVTERLATVAVTPIGLS